jgi:hypothetical protein
VIPPDATRRALRCSRESRRCFFAYRLCYVSRDKHYRMFPSPTMIISIRIPDTRCLISPCKIPANLPYHPRLGSPRWPREPRRKTPESSRTFFLRYAGTLSLLSAWLSVTCWVGIYLSRVTLWCEQGHIEFVIFITHHTMPHSAWFCRKFWCVDALGRVIPAWRGITGSVAKLGSVPITGTSRSLIQIDRQGRYAPQITFAEGLPRWTTRHVTAGIRSAPCMAVWRQTPG